MNIFLGIDPSINTVGFAILQISGGNKFQQWSGGTIHTDKEDGLIQRCEFIAKSIQKGLPYIPQQLVIEYPQFMQGDRGLIAAQKGYTIDLACICGFLAAYLLVKPLNTTLYTPVQWKGQKPKTATEAAFKRSGIKLNQQIPPSEHQIDATMLLHYHLKKQNLI